MRPQFYPPALNGLIKQLTATWQRLSKQILPSIVFFLTSVFAKSVKSLVKPIVQFW